MSRTAGIVADVLWFFFKIVAAFIFSVVATASSSVAAVQYHERHWDAVVAYMCICLAGVAMSVVSLFDIVTKITEMVKEGVDDDA